MWKAGNGTRTRDPNLGKVVLYQLSYSRDSCSKGDRPVTTRNHYFITLPCSAHA